MVPSWSFLKSNDLEYLPIYVLEIPIFSYKVSLNESITFFIGLNFDRIEGYLNIQNIILSISYNMNIRYFANKITEIYELIIVFQPFIVSNDFFRNTSLILIEYSIIVFLMVRAFMFSKSCPPEYFIKVVHVFILEIL